MSARIPFIAANWKMNPTPAGALDRGSPYQPRNGIDIVVLPALFDIAACKRAGLIVGGQYGHPQASGASTGDVSIAMLKAAGCTSVLCGHSERRKNHGETSEWVAAMVVEALKTGLSPILCIGETAEEHAQRRTEEVLELQLQTVLAHLSSPESPASAKAMAGRQVSSLVIAYEPVWAISGGDASKAACDPETAQRMHALIRSWLPPGLKQTRILYGGSMKPENAEELLRQPDIDGGLVGAASLDAKKFASIVETAVRVFVKKSSKHGQKGRSSG